MIKRRTTLEDALEEIESGVLLGVTAIVVNQEWWQQLTRTVQGGYRKRCTRSGVDLRADDALSRHFVELATDQAQAPLSTERRI